MSSALRHACTSLIDPTGVTTVAERNIALGHKRAQVFETFYLAQRRDVQAAYVGCPSKDALTQALGQMSLTRDPRIPKTLTVEQSADINNDTKVRRLQRRAQQSYRYLKTTHGGVQKARGTDAYRKHQKYGKYLRKAKQQRREMLKRETREAFYEEIQTTEVERQACKVDGPEPTLAEYNIATVSHVFKERTRLAETLFESFVAKQGRDVSFRDARISAIEDMVSLCDLQEAPRREKDMSLTESDTTEDSTSLELELFPIVCPGTR